MLLVHQWAFRAAQWSARCKCQLPWTSSSRQRGRVVPYCSASTRATGHLGTPALTSTANAYVKHCCKLRTDRSYRLHEGSVLVVGLTPLLELSSELENLEIKVLLWAGSGQPPDGLRYAKVVSVNEPVMRKASGLLSTEGLVAAAEVALPKQQDLCALPQGQLTRLLVLDAVQDPGNLGTLLRTALALGWQGAYLMPGCCDPFNDKALRASRGAAFKLPLSSGDWQGLQQVLRHHKLACLAAQPTEDLAGCRAPQQPGTVQQSLAAPVALVLGSEGRGLSAEVKENSTHLSVPMSGSMESLSVSQAGAILMFMLSSGLPKLLAELNEPV